MCSNKLKMENRIKEILKTIKLPAVDYRHFGNIEEEVLIVKQALNIK